MKLKLAATTIATVALVGTALTGGVAVAATPTAAPAVAAAHDCGNGITNVTAKESVKIRTTKKVNGTAVGLWLKGGRGDLCDNAKATVGEKYTLCGKTSDKWYWGDSRGVQGYVPAACINW
ncbi:hypothetical protein ACFVT5_10980 [Streptomyces sp. NPDC058001]|uniref:hypothetical protein n=1 Tax=Streptomyces sp. NPDC058001 TaxID=3346300 RepID=UPI0036E92594